MFIQIPDIQLATFFFAKIAVSNHVFANFNLDLFDQKTIYPNNCQKYATVDVLSYKNIHKITTMYSAYSGLRTVVCTPWLYVARE